MESGTQKLTILIAPAAFKGSLSAPQVAEEIAAFLREHWGDALQLVVCPVADGGDDTLSVLQAAIPQAIGQSATVTGPVASMQVEAHYLWLPEQKTVVLEAAQAHGLKLLQGQLMPMQATSYGLGELMAQAVQRHQPEQVVITVGGSASTDGGLGALQALGVQFQTEAGDLLTSPISGEDLATVSKVVWPSQWAYTGRLVIATDVLNPLLGKDGAAAVFGPQKGATPEQCALLDAGLTQVSRLFSQVSGADLSTLPGAGAAGGLAYGLRHLPRSAIISGSQWLAGLLDLTEKIEQADIIITGEGRLDSTTFAGKATGMILALAEHRPIVVLCGQVQEGFHFTHGVDVLPLITDSDSLVLAMAEPRLALRKRLAAALPRLESLFSAALPKPAS